MLTFIVYLLAGLSILDISSHYNKSEDSKFSLITRVLGVVFLWPIYLPHKIIRELLAYCNG